MHVLDVTDLTVEDLRAIAERHDLRTCVRSPQAGFRRRSIIWIIARWIMASLL